MSFLTAFNLLTRLTVLWAFGVLALFASLHGIAIGLFLGLFALAVISRDRGFTIHSNIWLLISITVIGGALYGWFFIGERFYSVVYVFLYLILNKTWTGTRNRDFLQLYGLSFFLILATAVSTSSVFFAFALVVYLFLVLTSLITVTIKDDAERALLNLESKKKRRLFLQRKRVPSKALVLAHGGRTALERLFTKQYLTASYFKWLTGALVFILIVTSVVFTIIPRAQARNYFAGFGGGSVSGARSGFSDSIEFNAMGEIQTNPTIVMRAIPSRGWEMENNRPTFSVLRLRGTALDYFDGRRWEKGPRVTSRLRVEERSRVVSYGRGRVIRDAFQSEPRFITTIQTQPTSRGYLFAPDRPSQYYFDFDIATQVDSESLSIQAAPWNETMTYHVESGRMARDWYEKSMERNQSIEEIRSSLEMVDNSEGGPEVSPMRLSQLSHFDSLEEHIHGIYLQLPEVPDMDVVSQLAGEWTEGEEDRLRQVRKIENRLRFEFGYTLDVGFSTRADHLAHFLTTAREGHCEYFATAMALMLRVKGIPSRVVNGYATDEWVNTGGGYYLVRQEHAHSWVEAWFPSAGWITFDPTPSAGIGANRVPSTLYRRFTRWMDSMRLVWYRSVIDYSAQDQAFVYGTIHRFMRMLPDPSSILDGSILRTGGTQTFTGRRAFLLLITLACIGGAFYIIIRESRRLIRKRSVQGTIERATAANPHTTVYIHLLEALRALQPRPESQTPLEYARLIAGRRSDLHEFLTLTHHYYASRFSDLAWTDEDTQTARRLLQQIRNGEKEQSPSPGRA
ncbi:MAG: DUF3488 domain-containing protein [Candidatus Sumerlaeia bacterium]|nr:DUF3488 domain-containing protein [Candidatus Sumerlaeia bacterium]